MAGAKRRGAVFALVTMLAMALFSIAVILPQRSALYAAETESLSITGLSAICKEGPTAGLNAEHNFYCTNLRISFALPLGQSDRFNIAQSANRDDAQNKKILENIRINGFTAYEISGVVPVWAPDNKTPIDINVLGAAKAIDIYIAAFDQMTDDWKTATGIDFDAVPFYFKGDGTDTVEILSDFTSYDGEQIASASTYKYRTGTYSDKNITDFLPDALNGWKVQTPPVAAAVTVDYGTAKTVGDRYNFSFHASSAAAGFTLGGVEGLESEETVGENILFGGRSVKALNESTSGSATVEFDGAYIRASVKISVLDTLEEKTVLINTNFAYGGVTVAGAYDAEIIGRALVSKDALEVVLSGIGPITEVDPFIEGWCKNYSVDLTFKTTDGQNAQIYDGNLNNISMRQNESVETVLDSVVINGYSMSDIMAMGNIAPTNYRIDANIMTYTLRMYIGRENPTSENYDLYKFKFDGTDTIEVKAGLIGTSGQATKQDATYKLRNGIWTLLTPAVPGTVTPHDICSGSALTDTQEFTFATDGSLGVDVGLEANASVSDNVSVNGKTVTAINAETPGGVSIEYFGNAIIVSVKNTLLKLDNTDTVAFLADFACEGISLTGALTFTYSYTNGLMTSAQKVEKSLRDVEITSVGGILAQENGTDKKFTIQFSETITPALQEHFDAIYTNLNWLQTVYANRDTYYGDAKIQEFILGGMVDSALDKIWLKEGAGEYETMRTVYNKTGTFGDIMLHYGQAHVEGIDTTALSIWVKTLDVTKTYSLKVEKGFVTPGYFVTDKEYIFHYNPKNQGFTPDESIQTRTPTKLQGISKVNVSGDGVQSFFVRLGRSAAYAEVADALAAGNTKDSVKINGKTLKEILSGTVDASGAPVANAVTASYRYQEDGNPNIVLFVTLSREAAEQYGFRFDGHDYVGLMKNFETPNKSYLNAFWAGFLKTADSDAGWTYESDTTDEVLPPKPAAPDGGCGKGCGNAKAALAAIAALMMSAGVLMLFKKR